MKVYLVFKVKDMTKKHKEFIVDSIHTTILGAKTHEKRLHKRDVFRLVGMNGVLRSKYQHTYIINKSLKGLINGKDKIIGTENSRAVAHVGRDFSSTTHNYDGMNYSWSV